MIKLKNQYFQIEQCVFYHKRCKVHYIQQNDGVICSQFIELKDITQYYFLQYYNQYDFIKYYNTEISQSSLTANKSNTSNQVIFPKLLYKLLTSIHFIPSYHSEFLMPCYLPQPNIFNFKQIELSIQNFDSFKNHISSIHQTASQISFSLVSSSIQWQIVSEIVSRDMKSSISPVLRATIHQNDISTIFLQVQIFSNQYLLENIKIKVVSFNQKFTGILEFKVVTIKQIQNVFPNGKIMFPRANINLLASQKIKFPNKILVQVNEKVLGEFQINYTNIDLGILFEFLFDQNDSLNVRFLSDKLEEISQFATSLVPKIFQNEAKNESQSQLKKYYCFANFNITNFFEGIQVICLNGGLTQQQIDAKIVIQIEKSAQEITCDIDNNLNIQYLTHVGRYFLEEQIFDRVQNSCNYQLLEQLIQLYKKLLKSQLYYIDDYKCQKLNIINNANQINIQISQFMYYQRKILEKIRNSPPLKRFIGVISQDFILCVKQYYQDNQLIFQNSLQLLYENYSFYSIQLVRVMHFSSNCSNIQQKIKVKSQISDLMNSSIDQYSSILAEHSVLLRFIISILDQNSNFKNFQDLLFQALQKDLQECLNSYFQILSICELSQDQIYEVINIIQHSFSALKLTKYSFCEYVSKLQKELTENKSYQEIMKKYYLRYLENNSDSLEVFSILTDIQNFNSFQYEASISYYFKNLTEEIIENKFISSRSILILNNIQNISCLDMSILSLFLASFSYLMQTDKEIQVFLSLTKQWLIQINLDPFNCYVQQISPYVLVNIIKFSLYQKYETHFRTVVINLLSSQYKQQIINNLIKIAIYSDLQIQVQINNIIFPNISVDDIYKANSMQIQVDYQIFTAQQKFNQFLIQAQEYSLKLLLTNRQMLFGLNHKSIDEQYLQSLLNLFAQNNDIRQHFILDCLMIFYDKCNNISAFHNIVQQKLDLLSVTIDPYFILFLLYNYYKNLVLDKNNCSQQRNLFINTPNSQKLYNFLLIDDVCLIKQYLCIFEDESDTTFINLLFKSLPQQLLSFRSGQESILQIQDYISTVTYLQRDSNINLQYFTTSSDIVGDSSFWIKFQPRICLPRLEINDFKLKKSGCLKLQYLILEQLLPPNFSNINNFKAQTDFAQIVGIMILPWPKIQIK
ncbi:hypothetical protein SS50377_22109 [Spironucleus salmonicida]|uniref:Uncharacterized protein n=1 Tax=Spironucleus salmonicida TaxID=348837 RepID=A0A9P8S125_9EUKA|nr:hypothetical protein SS50377_22109 [Spironucleus salmonicida]